MSTTETPTPPSAGAVRAALALAHPTVRFAYEQTDPSLSRVRLNASEEIHKVARIIDRETRAKELEQDKARLDWLDSYESDDWWNDLSSAPGERGKLRIAIDGKMKEATA